MHHYSRVARGIDDLVMRLANTGTDTLDLMPWSCAERYPLALEHYE